MRYSRLHNLETRPGEVFVMVYGSPLPPPARGSHWLSIRGFEAPPVLSFDTSSDTAGYRWSQGYDCGQPLPPPARGSHSSHVKFICPCPVTDDPAVDARHKVEAILAARWSRGDA